VSFSDRPGGPNFRKIGFALLILVLGFANLFLLMAWWMSFYDLDLVKAPRSIDLTDLIIPAAWMISAAFLWFYHRLFVRDKI
jgi:hypothetical protein